MGRLDQLLGGKIERNRRNSQTARFDGHCGRRRYDRCLHWVMDMIFRDDECRIRTDHAPANFTTLKHMAHNLIRKAPGKDSMRLKRKVAAWDDDFLASLIAA